MTKFWSALGVFLLWSLFTVVIHEYLGNTLLGNCAIPHNTSKSKNDSNQPTEAITSSQLTKNNTEKDFLIKVDNGKAVFNFEKGFEISSLNGNVITPDELVGLKDSIYNYLNNNQNQELLITVKHLASEANINGNHLGILRAKTLEKMCIDAGINPTKITTEIVESAYNYDTTNKFYSAISFGFKTISNERIVEVEKSIANKTLYSNFAVRGFLPDRDLVAYTIELKNYLKKYPNKKVYVVGHTDSVGTNNYAFGLARANNVKDYLISQDISSAIIKATSKGESVPIADNKTDQGRAKNRRIEITIK